MTIINPTTSGPERSAPAAPHTEANDTAAAFEIVLRTMASVNLDGVDVRTVDAFQRVLDVVTSFDLSSFRRASAQVTHEAPSPSPEVAPAPAQRGFLPPPVPLFPAAPRSASVPAALVVAAPAAPVVAAPAAPVVAAPAAPAVAAPPFVRTTPPWEVGGFFGNIPPQPLTAIPDPPHAGDDAVWYCIYQGKFVGVTLSHGAALSATVGVRGGRMRSYKTQLLALRAFNDALASHGISVVP
ncbi:hypothetical protein R3P38DRAFT_3177398 [Favolaschia claudopus]|uniref:DRBM domain-containing protein n=1 Tax=Favolaschia claudopus TaxID=2862362 RepID=A0AAW0D3C5_9AGAR